MAQEGFTTMLYSAVPSAVQKICCHKQLKCNFWVDWELWDFCAAVGVADFVHKVLADFGKNMRPASKGQVLL